MESTVYIIKKISQMVNQGKMLPEDVPVTDIICCVRLELDVNHNTFLEAQYSEVNKSFNSFTEYIKDGEAEKEKVLMFLEGMLICLNTISMAVRSLANRDYWSYKHRDEMDNPEIIEIIDYIERKKNIRLLNYDFTETYDRMDVEIGYDADCDMIYVPYQGRKMFFPEGWQPKQAEEYFRSIMAEQDARSPHNYRKTGYTVRDGDNIVDVGAAEGIFALTYIDRVSHAYLLEADAGWIKALKQTFCRDTDKVTVVKGMVGNQCDDDEYITIDRVCAGQRVDYIKMDIEGHEMEAMYGADNTFRNNENIRCAICAYHRKDDEDNIRAFLARYDFEMDHSRGFICPDWTVEGRLDAELRRGIIFGRKK